MLIGFRVNFLLVITNPSNPPSTAAYGVPARNGDHHGNIPDILVSLGSTRLAVFQQMKMLVVQHFTLSRSQVIKQEVVGSMRCRNRVKADNARLGSSTP